MVKPLGEGGDGLGVGDVGDGISCFREMSDEVPERISRSLM
jgi:hypothetical protein